MCVLPEILQAGRGLASAISQAHSSARRMVSTSAATCSSPLSRLASTDVGPHMTRPDS